MKNTRMTKMREGQAAMGLIPLRLTEIWCTSEEQKIELKLEFAKLVVKSMAKHKIVPRETSI